MPCFILMMMIQKSIIVWLLGKPSLKKNILLLTFVNKDLTPPPLIIDEKPLRFGGQVRGVTPFIKVKNNIV